MEPLIEDMILDHLQGEADYHVTDLLRKAREEIIMLRLILEDVVEQNHTLRSDAAWLADASRERAEIDHATGWH